MKARVQRTITFQPDADVKRVLSRKTKGDKPHGFQTWLINRALRIGFKHLESEKA